MFSLLSRLIGRLTVGRKLALIYLLDLTTVVFISGILINEKYIAINFSRKYVMDCWQPSSTMAVRRRR